MRGRICSVAAAAMLVLPAIVAGGASAAVVKAGPNPIGRGSSSCGTVLGAGGVGTVRLTRSGDAAHPGNQLGIKVKLGGARPHTLYEARLYGDGCAFLGSAGSVRTNKSGSASIRATVEIPEADGTFFIDAEEFLSEMMSEPNESVAVRLKCTELSWKCR